MNIFRYFYHKLVGEYKIAVKNGMKCGKGVYPQRGVVFGSEPYLITLGDRVRIGRGVTFVTHDGATNAFRREKKYQGIHAFGRITVEDDTFIGLNAIILPGVHIGKSCVIGAGSVVTHDVPDRSVAAGVPAKVICTLDEYAEKCRARMPEGFDESLYRADKKGYLSQIY